MLVSPLCQPVIIFAVLSLLICREGALCFLAIPISIPMNPNSAPFRPGANGGGGGGGGSSWAAMAAAPSYSSSEPSSNSGVDLSRYVQQPPRRRKAPIYIPIGPPCAGKTTTLSRILVPANVTASNQLSNNHHLSAAGRTAGRDISIDDQDGVYMQIPTRLFLVDDPKSPRPNGADGTLLNQTVHGKSIYNRLYSDGANDELRVVLRRLAGKITKEEFREAVMRQMGCWNSTNEAESSDSNNESEQPGRLVGRHGGPLQIPASTVAKYLIAAVEHYAESETLTSSGHLRDANHPILGRDGYTDLFVLEAIFRSTNVIEGGRSRTRPSGLNLALSKMERLACNSSALPPDVPLAWGNTNTRPREYTSGLEVAQKSGRPIVFVPHVNPTVVSVQGEGGPGSSSEFLYHVELDELYLRSIKRLIYTGRYVPATAIKDAAFRCDSLMLSAKAEMCRMFPTTQDHKPTDPIISGDDDTKQAQAMRTFQKFQLECSLAKLAGYQLNADRTVVKIRENDSDNRAESGGYRGSVSSRGSRNPYGRGQYRDGRGGGNGRGGGYGRGYGRGYDDRNGGRVWNSRPGRQQQGGRGYDQQKRSYDGSRQWSPSRHGQPPYDRADNRTTYPR